MARRRRRNENEAPGPAGFLVVDKPSGMTSHDVVDRARRWLGTRRIGHLGTLDPQATGVLPLAVREATKLVPFLQDGAKAYVGTVRFGVETDTLDGEGKVLREHEGKLPTRAEVEAALAPFRGDIEQIPPMFSAVKQGGVPLHRLARKGELVERPPKKVRIDRLELVRFEEPYAELAVECSAGTYVRALAADLGERLGCGGYLYELRRMRSGPFLIADATPLDALDEAADQGKIDERLVPPARALDIASWELSEAAVARVRNGGDVSPGTSLRAAPGDRVAGVDAEGRLVAILELRPDRRLWPVRVLRPAD